MLLRLQRASPGIVFEPLRLQPIAPQTIEVEKQLAVAMSDRCVGLFGCLHPISSEYHQRYEFSRQDRMLQQTVVFRCVSRVTTSWDYQPLVDGFTPRSARRCVATDAPQIKEYKGARLPRVGWTRFSLSSDLTVVCRSVQTKG
jgi:hypothetical protein